MRLEGLLKRLNLVGIDIEIEALANVTNDGKVQKYYSSIVEQIVGMQVIIYYIDYNRIHGVFF